MVANTLGLNDSEFQYVIDALEMDELRREREERDAEDMRQVGRDAILSIHVAITIAITVSNARKFERNQLLIYASAQSIEV